MTISLNVWERSTQSNLNKTHKVTQAKLLKRHCSKGISAQRSISLVRFGALCELLHRKLITTVMSHHGSKSEAEQAMGISGQGDEIAAL